MRPSVESRGWSGLGPDGRPLLVNCDHDTDDDLCKQCTSDLKAVLADVPALLVDLDVAIRRQVRFVDQGTQHHQRLDDVDEEQRESRLPFNDRASAARQRLLGTLLHIGELGSVDPVPVVIAAQLGRLVRISGFGSAAHHLTSAASRGHRVIDMPTSATFYGPCPECGRDIYGERLDDKDPAARVVCTGHDCVYAAHPIDHRRGLLDDGDERWLTISELVGAISLAGEFVTRKQIEGWIRHHGLAREVRTGARWANGKLVPGDPVHVYRLGDVRDRARKVVEARSAITVAELAQRCGIAEAAVRTYVRIGQLEPMRKSAKPLKFTEAEVERFTASRQ